MKREKGELVAIVDFLSRFLKRIRKMELKLSFFAVRCIP